MSYSPSPPSRLVAIEQLETRRLLADPWGPIPKLVRQDLAAQQFPQVTGEGVAIAIIDTGIDYEHPLLGGGIGPGKKVIGGYDFVDNDTDPMDTYGHGTEVAGIIAADPFEFEGGYYQGVAPEAKLLALRVDAANDPVPDERIERALQWVIDNQSTYNIVAANISFGSGRYAAEHTSIYSDELATLKARGVFVAAASGNGGVSEPFGVEYPAADPSVFAVGAVDQFDLITEYTERGVNLDILAPGDDVVTTVEGFDPAGRTSGTSFAVPYVCGAVALMKHANPDLRVADITSIFRAGSSDNIDGDSEFGSVTNLTFPRLDLYNSVALSLARRPGMLGASGEVATAGNGNDVAFDRDGVLHIVYYDSIERNLKYVTRGTDGGISSPIAIDVSGNDVGGYVSIDVDDHSRPAVAYFDGTSGDLRFAHFNGQSWDVEIVDSRGSVGLYPAITYDTYNRPVISYFRKTSGDLRVARMSGGIWDITAVDVTDTVGRSTDITCDPTTGEIAVAYEDSTRGWLRIARNNDEGWSINVVDNLTRGVTYPSVAFNANHEPAISYYDIHNADLKYAQLAAGAWQTQKLASKGAQGLYTQLYFTSDGLANIIYYNRKNNLVMKVSGNMPTWSAEALQSAGGRYIALDIDPLDDSIAYTWFQPGVAKLRVADV